jgi:hypothetical protein
MESVLYDAAEYRRSPATMLGYLRGRPPSNRGLRYRDPPAVEEIVAVMRAADNSAHGARLRALIVILWRAGLRIGEALDLAETDHDPARGAVLVRRSGFCSGPATNRSSSTDLVAARATKKQRVTANARRLERAAQSSATSAWAACNTPDCGHELARAHIANVAKR